jgi:hypothetical protein
MIILKHTSFNFEDNQLPDFVDSVSKHQYGTKFTLKDNIASGDYKLLEFSNGFYAYSSNYILNQDFEIELSVIKDDYLALHINQIQAGSIFKISLNNRTVSYDDKIVTSLFLTAGKDSFKISGTKGALVNRIKIMVPKVWLAKNLPAFNEAMLNSYMSLDEDRLYTDSLDNTYRSMIDKIMNTEDNAFYLSITQNIIAVITERFFNRLVIRIQKNQKLNEINDKLA